MARTFTGEADESADLEYRLARDEEREPGVFRYRRNHAAERRLDALNRSLRVGALDTKGGR